MEKAVPDFLYHYTSINTLGLILKHRTLRLNNLTAMDDLDEADFGGKNWGKYCFISSWTEDAEESIPMWNMYSNNMRGVRIKMQTYPFKEYGIEGLKTIVPMEAISVPTHTIGTYMQNQILFNVEYDDIEYKKAMKDASIIEINGGQIEFSGDRLGKWKNQYWDFQKEWRYRLIIYPIGLYNIAQDPFLYNQQLQDFANVVDLPFSDYYLHLRDDAVNTMEVVLGPKTNEIDFEIVQMLADKYSPGIAIKKSALAGKIR